MPRLYHSVVLDVAADAPLSIIQSFLDNQNNGLQHIKELKLVCESSRGCSERAVEALIKNLPPQAIRYCLVDSEDIESGSLFDRLNSKHPELEETRRAEQVLELHNPSTSQRTRRETMLFGRGRNPLQPSAFQDILYHNTTVISFEIAFNVCTTGRTMSQSITTFHILSGKLRTPAYTMWPAERAAGQPRSLSCSTLPDGWTYRYPELRSLNTRSAGLSLCPARLEGLLQGINLSVLSTLILQDCSCFSQMLQALGKHSDRLVSGTLVLISAEIDDYASPTLSHTISQFLSKFTGLKKLALIGNIDEMPQLEALASHSASLELLYFDRPESELSIASASISKVCVSAVRI